MNKEIMIIDEDLGKSKLLNDNDQSFMFGETFGNNMSKQEDDDEDYHHYSTKTYQVDRLSLNKDNCSLMKKYFEEVSSIGLIKIQE